MLFACNPSSDKNTMIDTSKEASIEPPTTEEIISDIRKKFNEINQNTASYEAKSKEIMGESTEGGELNSYFENEELKKMVANYFGEMGRSIEEYYFSENNVFFVFTQQLSYDKPMYVEGSKAIKTDENRYYFHNDQLIQWLDTNKEKVPNSSFNQKESELFEKIKALMEK